MAHINSSLRRGREAAARLCPPAPGRAASGRGRPSRAGSHCRRAPEGVAAAGAAPRAPRNPPQLPNACRARHPAPNARGRAAEGAPLPLSRAARREGGRKAKESGRVPTALTQLTQEGRKAQERSQQPHGCTSDLLSLRNLSQNSMTAAPCCTAPPHSATLARRSFRWEVPVGAFSWDSGRVEKRGFSREGRLPCPVRCRMPCGALGCRVVP